LRTPEQTVRIVSARYWELKRAGEKPNFKNLLFGEVTKMGLEPGEVHDHMARAARIINNHAAIRRERLKKLHANQ